MREKLKAGCRHAQLSGTAGLVSAKLILQDTAK